MVVDQIKIAAVFDNYPPVMIFRNKKRGNIYPTFWECEPREGHIDLGNYVVRTDVFRRHAHEFGKRYAGDFDFIHALWRHQYQFFWYRKIIAHAQTVGLGRSEKELDMKVRALTSFAGVDINGTPHSIAAGAEFELPPGVDWVQAGLVVPVDTEPEQATSKRASKREKRA